MSLKSEYHYKKAKSLLRKLEDEAHMVSKKDEHARLMEVVDKHMELYRSFRDEELRASQPYQQPYRHHYNPGIYGTTLTSNSTGESTTVLLGDNTIGKED